MLRIKNNMIFYELWKDEMGERIVPVAGDLSKVNFGLSEGEFLDLARKVSVIYHNGALVNFFYPYTVNKGANVFGTKEIIRLATLYRVKPIHFISTAAVFASEHNDSTIALEEEMPGYNTNIGIGYVQSKWVAEHILQIARDRGVPVSIYRCGRVFSHSKSGVCQPNDFIWNLFLGSIEAGVFPDSSPEIEIIPVDYVSKSVVYLSQQNEHIGQNFHLIQTETISFQTFYHAALELNYSLKLVPYEEWMDSLQSKHVLDKSKDSAKAIGSHLLTNGVFNDNQIILSNRKTRRLLSKAGIEILNIDITVIKANLSFFERKGIVRKH
ncbi:long-chain-fatty-acid-CoA ligase [Paenibacillus sp. JCM 10914]|nr:thioester reductase domain-containing protein [Paenibacillus sp. JCM 10914]GAE06769.1 long-chain-fatty-acid-CoA ligase [Paenibacillus sp. JCM 10914]